MFEAGLPAKSLLPDEEPEFVAEIEEPLILAVVAATHKVRPQLMQQSHILAQLLCCHPNAAVRVGLMAIHALQDDRLTIDQHVTRCRLNDSEPEPNSHAVHLLDPLPERDGEQMQVGVTGRPDPGPGHRGQPGPLLASQQGGQRLGCLGRVSVEGQGNPEAAAACAAALPSGAGRGEAKFDLDLPQGPASTRTDLHRLQVERSRPELVRLHGTQEAPGLVPVEVGLVYRPGRQKPVVCQH
mmetsp:Transcript_33996/g.107961  ORF Transcript_33996/g.107961 Transcript_33996/m.107961 type:complete len:240 (-) Transcript_33996:931-1650(-)